jgi:hypothetical protein
VTVQDLGSIGELVAAIATVATLAYLAVQIRQNTISVRAATFQSYVESAGQWLATGYRDRELSELWSRGRSGLDGLDSAERERFTFMVLAFFRVFENAYFQVQQGLVQELEWEGIRESFLQRIDSPGLRAWWDENAIRYNTPFRRFIE